MGLVADIVICERLPVGPEAICGVMSDHSMLCSIAPNIMRQVNVKSRRAETYLAEERIFLGGRLYLSMVRHTLECPQYHLYRIVGGDAKGSAVTEQFQPQNGHTNVTVTIRWKTGIFSRSSGIADGYRQLLRDACTACRP